MNIPEYPEFRRMELSDHKIVEAQLQKNKIEIAELTFPNLYAWRDYEAPVMTWLNDNLVILSDSHSEGPNCFMQPVGTNKVKETIEICLNYLVEKKAKDPRLERVSETFVKQYALEDHFECVYDRDNSDYIYKVSELAELKGRKYDGKRNHINKITVQGNYSYASLQPDNLAAAGQVLTVWFESKKQKETLENMETLIYGKKAIEEYLNCFAKSKLFGGAVFKDEEMVAFTIAYPINTETAINYCEVVIPSEKGLNQYMFHEFCKNDLSKFKFINREQDLGHSGIRKAKLSYYPDHFGNKYIVRAKK
jgi:uncharacterized protein